MVVSPSFAQFRKNTHCKLFFFFFNQLLEAVSLSTSNSLNSCPRFLWFQLAVKMPVPGRRKTVRSSHTNHFPTTVANNSMPQSSMCNLEIFHLVGSPTAGWTAGAHLSPYSEDLPGKGLAGFIASYKGAVDGCSLLLRAVFLFCSNLQLLPPQRLLLPSLARAPRGGQSSVWARTSPSSAPLLCQRDPHGGAAARCVPGDPVATGQNSPRAISVLLLPPACPSPWRAEAQQTGPGCNPGTGRAAVAQPSPAPLL